MPRSRFQNFGRLKPLSHKYRWNAVWLSKSFWENLCSTYSLPADRALNFRTSYIFAHLWAHTYYAIFPLGRLNQSAGLPICRLARMSINLDAELQQCDSVCCTVSVCNPFLVNYETLPVHQIAFCSPTSPSKQWQQFILTWLSRIRSMG